jgi:hypothetical protein
MTPMLWLLYPHIARRSAIPAALAPPDPTNIDPFKKVPSERGEDVQ